ncbi:hypothetical protein DPMN_142100 [Dreissena polymorpha]|uniref:Uncharacterized protein n=1 Tax=Dreissena polymorpha TaxID=45954 RepID=A0A9D4JIV9_DREPO|nr:hypothetical protein DPMN_142100 [Dreissena polymorpha]
MDVPVSVKTGAYVLRPQHSPSRVERIGVFAYYTELSTRAKLTLSRACPRRNSSRDIIGPGVTEDLKLMSDDDFFESGSQGL